MKAVSDVLPWITGPPATVKVANFSPCSRFSAAPPKPRGPDVKAAWRGKGPRGARQKT